MKDYQIVIGVVGIPPLLDHLLQQGSGLSCIGAVSGPLRQIHIRLDQALQEDHLVFHRQVLMAFRQNIPLILISALLFIDIAQGHIGSGFYLRVFGNINTALEV